MHEEIKINFLEGKITGSQSFYLITLLIHSVLKRNGQNIYTNESNTIDKCRYGKVKERRKEI